MNDYSKDGDVINSIIGENNSFIGDMELDGLLRIDGDCQGNINTKGRILIGKSGRVHCHIMADTVVIGGMFKGDIKASSKVVLLSSSFVIGNIISPRIIVEHGVILNGICVISKNKNLLETEYPEHVEKFSIDWQKLGYVKSHGY